MSTSILVSEANVKKSIEEYLMYKQNLGQLMFLRLNSGELIAMAGKTRRRIKLCPPGTYDFVIFQAVKYELFHDGQAFGLCKSRSACRVTFVETKSSKGKTSKAQDEFAEEARKVNCRCFTIRDADQLEEILE